MQATYESVLDAGKMVLKSAEDHPDCPSFHKRKLAEMQQELDAMYGAVISNKEAP